MSNDTSFRFPNAAPAIREAADGASARFPGAAPVQGEPPVRKEVPVEGMLEGTHAQKPKKPKKPVLTSTPFLFDVRDADVASAIEREGVPVLLCFVASWCVPCKQIKSVLIQIAHEFQDKAYVATVELDNAALAVARYGINAAPTTIVFYGGQEVSRFIGANTSAPKIRKLLKHAYEADRLESPDQEETLATSD